MAEAIISSDATAVDNAVVDNAEVADESAVVDTATETQDDTTSEESDASTEETEVSTAPVADKVKGLVESLKKTDPALAKEIKNLFFAADALKKEIPGGLPEVRQMKATLEELGGKEGIESLKAEKAEWSQIDEKFANGDPTVLDEFAQFNPEGFAKLIPGALDKLATIDRDAYNHSLAGVFVSTLDSWRFMDSLERMAENLSRIVDDKGNQLCGNEIKRLEGMAKQYESLREMASKVPQAKTDTEKQKLESERAQLAQERTQIATTYVADSTQKYAERKYAQFIPVESRNRKFDVEALKKISYGDDQGTAFDRFQREIDSEVAQLIRQDPATVKKIQDAVTAGRKEDAVKLSNSKFDAVVQTAIKRVVGRWATTFNPRGATAKAGTKQETVTASGVKQLESAPELSLVDQSDPAWRINYMMHSKAKLKTGQRVAW